jgi:hypothetical protein
MGCLGSTPNRPRRRRPFLGWLVQAYLSAIAFFIQPFHLGGPSFPTEDDWR